MQHVMYKMLGLAVVIQTRSLATAKKQTARQQCISLKLSYFLSP